jgi:hypothetical protein
MAASILELKEQAHKLGIPSSLIRANLHDRAELQKVIASFEKGKAHVESVTAKAKAKPQIQKKGATMAVKAKAKVKAAAKRGRPKGSTNKAKATATVVKRGRGRPKGSTNKSKSVATRTVRKSSNGDAGRNILGRINFKKRTGWNPREGSATFIIFEALVANDADREKVYKKLAKRAGKLFPNAANPDAMLKYRIARTLFDFAVQTGQHTKATNRAEYGTAGTGNGTRSKRKGKAVVKKATAGRTTGRKRGRPKGSTNKPKAAPVKRGRGRPKGSTNKAKARRK